MTKIQSTANYSIDDIAQLMSRGFSDYIAGTHAMDVSYVSDLIRYNNVDLETSLVAFDGSGPFGVVLVARRERRSRVAAMAVVPESRGLGAGRQLLDHVLRDADGRGDHEVVLECFEQNSPAMRLYESAGFATTRRLLGFKCDSLEASNVRLK